jgi:uncharacterized membrane protein
MPFCPNCGSSVDGRFCAKCGATVDAPGAGPAYTGPGPTPAPAAGGLTDNVAAALCYVLGLITGILFLVLTPYNQNKTIRFHAFQSIFMHVAVIAIYIVLGIAVSAFLGFVGALLFPLLGIAIFVLWIYMIISAYQGKSVELPVIGSIARQQA